GCQRKLGHWRSRLPGWPTAYSVSCSAYRRLYLQANNGRLCTTQTDGASLSHRCAVRHCAGGVATLPYSGKSDITPTGTYSTEAVISPNKLNLVDITCLTAIVVRTVYAGDFLFRKEPVAFAPFRASSRPLLCPFSLRTARAKR